MVAQAPDGGARLDRCLRADGARDGAADDRLGDRVPFTRHPVQVAMDARVVQEAAGPGRFILGFGTSKIFLNNTKEGGPPKVTKPLAHMRDRSRSCAAFSAASRSSTTARFHRRHPGALRRGPRAARDVPVYVAGDGAEMQQFGGEIGDGLDPVDHHARFVRYTAGTSAGAASRAATRRRRPRLHDRRLDRRDRPRRGRDGAREIAGMYLANKVQNIQGSRRHAARARRDQAGGDPPGRRGDGEEAAGSRPRRR